MPKLSTPNSQALISLQPTARRRGEAYCDYEYRVKADLCAIEQRKAKESGQPSSEDVFIHEPTDETVIQCFQKWGSNPLGRDLEGEGLPSYNGITFRSSNPYLNIFAEMYIDMSPSPMQREKQAKEDMLRQVALGNVHISREDVFATFPKDGTEETKKEQAVWEQWRDGVRLYSPYQIYKLLDTTLGYSQWLKNHNLPELMDYVETLFLLRTLQASKYYRVKKTQEEHLAHLVEPTRAKHFFEVGPQRRAPKTKVGRIYGTWKLLECLSESELTSNNRTLFYKAECMVCGTVVDKFNYRYVARPCTNCANLTKVNRKLKNPITIYLNEDGTLVISPEKPRSAIAYATFEEANQVCGWQYYGAREIVPKTNRERHAPQDFTLDPDKLLKKEDLYGFD